MTEPSASGVLLLTLAVAACQSPWSPLTAPLPSNRTVLHAAHVVAPTSELSNWSATALALANTDTQLASAGQAIANWPDHACSPWQAAVGFSDVQASWTPAGSLRLEATVPPHAIDLSVTSATGPACAASWQVGARTASLDITLSLDATAAVVASATPVVWKIGRAHV